MHLCSTFMGEGAIEKNRICERVEIEGNSMDITRGWTSVILVCLSVQKNMCTK